MQKCCYGTDLILMTHGPTYHKIYLPRRTHETLGVQAPSGSLNPAFHGIATKTKKYAKMLLCDLMTHGPTYHKIHLTRSTHETLGVQAPSGSLNPAFHGIATKTKKYAKMLLCDPFDPPDTWVNLSQYLFNQHHFLLSYHGA